MKLKHIVALAGATILAQAALAERISIHYVGIVQQDITGSGNGKWSYTSPAFKRNQYDARAEAWASATAPSGPFEQRDTSWVKGNYLLRFRVIWKQTKSGETIPSRAWLRQERSGSAYAEATFSGSPNGIDSAYGKGFVDFGLLVLGVQAMARRSSAGTLTENVSARAKITAEAGPLVLIGTDSSGFQTREAVIDVATDWTGADAQGIAGFGPGRSASAKGRGADRIRFSVVVDDGTP